MGIVVTLSDTDPGDLLAIPGIAEQMPIEARSLQEVTRKFWGVAGESRISGGRGGRTIQVLVTIFDEENELFTTARMLADFIDYSLNTDAIDGVGTLQVFSESNHGPFEDCVFKGATIDPSTGIMLDQAGMMGGGYFATVMLEFRQMSMGAAEPPPEDP